MIKIKRSLYLISGCISLTLGIIGIFLPLLPTTCFTLLAAFCFSRSSDKFYQFLTSHPRFGNQIKNWQQHGNIPMRIKLLATSVMLLSVSYPFVFIEFHYGIKLLTVAAIVVALLYIWTHPDSPNNTKKCIQNNTKNTKQHTKVATLPLTQ